MMNIQKPEKQKQMRDETRKYNKKQHLVDKGN